jgi:hypothetical protein
VLSKFILGTVAYFLDLSDDGGFGEVLILIAVMIASRQNSCGGRSAFVGAPQAGDHIHS